MTGALWILGLSAGAVGYGQAPPQPPSATAPVVNDAGLANQQLRPFFVRSRRFSLPVQIAQSGYRIAAIQLYVSTDAGTSWQLYAQQPPTTPEFAFQAAEDGNYWFASKTVDHTGAAYPEGPPRAEQWVIVDTRQPAIKLGYEQGRAGEVTLFWQISDWALDPSSFKLDYREGILSAWQPLADVTAASQMVPSGSGGGGMSVTGRYAWRPNVQSRVLEVRLTAADRAGNVSTEIQRVFLPRSPSSTDRPESPPPTAAPTAPPTGGPPPSAPALPTMPAGKTVPVLTGGSLNASTSWPPQSPTETAQTRVADPTTSTATMAGTATVPGHTPWPAGNQPFPSEPIGQNDATAKAVPPYDTGRSQSTAAAPRGRNSTDRDPLSLQTTPPASTPLANPDRGNMADSAQPPLSSATQANQPTVSSSLPPEAPNRAPSQVNVNPSAVGKMVINPFYDRQPHPQSMAQGQDNDAGGESASGDVPVSSSYPPLSNQGESRNDTPPVASANGQSPWPDVPPGQALRMTRSRRFQLEYDLEAAVAGTITEVQLWGTRDMARTWEKWGTDHDRQSPFEVEVDRDGIYGFRVVLLAANGLATEVPRSGAPADLWVGVDGNPPVAEITGIEFGTGSRAGQVEIRWRAHDERLAPQPVSLSFSEHRDGPWTPISTGIANSGQYFWLVDASVPREVFVRLEVHDEAGNRTTYVIPQPISLSGLIPRARIRDVKPSDENRAR